MEKIGVAVGIIIDDVQENVESVVMKDDGTGNAIGIPSMLIGKTAGNDLLSYLESKSDEAIETIAIKVEFEMNKPDDRVEYDIWYTSSNDRALDFISNFAATDDKFKTNVLMTPHFVFWRCEGCDADLKKNDCFADGKYCAYEASNDRIKGTEIMLEDLR